MLGMRRESLSVGCREPSAAQHASLLGSRERHRPLCRSSSGAMWRLRVERRKARKVSSNLPSSSSDDEDCEPLACVHCGVCKFTTNASRRRHERTCCAATTPPSPASPEASPGAGGSGELVTVTFEHGPLGFALGGPDRRTCTAIYSPGHSRHGNEQATSQLRSGWTLVRVAGRRVRPERDLIMAQVKFAPRPVTLTWRTNGIKPPPPPSPSPPPTPAAVLPEEWTPQKASGRSERRRPSLPEFDEARRSLRKTLSGSLAGSPAPTAAEELPPPPSADEFDAVVRTLRKSLSSAELQV